MHGAVLAKKRSSELQFGAINEFSACWCTVSAPHILMHTADFLHHITLGAAHLIPRGGLCKFSKKIIWLSLIKK